MQVVTSSLSAQNEIGNKYQKDVRRLTPLDYSKAGLVKPYDWSVKDREAHDKEMEKYRQYLMKLCTLSHVIEGSSSKKGG
jgi:hypothetical protein